MKTYCVSVAKLNIYMADRYLYLSNTTRIHFAFPLATLHVLLVLATEIVSSVVQRNTFCILMFL